MQTNGKYKKNEPPNLFVRWLIGVISMSLKGVIIVIPVAFYGERCAQFQFYKSTVVIASRNAST